MTSMSNISMTLAEFTRLLDVYGADRTRWPAEARATAAHLVARDAEARQLLAEAEALDRVLQSAPVPALAVEAALAERIVAAAQRSPRIVKLPTVRPAAAAAAPAAAPPAYPDRPPQSRLLRRRARAASFLVASLAVGVLIGQLSLPWQMVPELAELAGLASDRGDLIQIALSDEVMQ
jgi:hypothetical protein